MLLKLDFSRSNDEEYLRRQILALKGHEKEAFFYKNLLDESVVYRLFPSTIYSEEDAYLWSRVLEGTISNRNNERLYLISAIVDMVEKDNRVSPYIVGVGESLLYNNRARRPATDPSAVFDIDKAVLLEELRAEKQRILRENGEKRGYP